VTDGPVNCINALWSYLSKLRDARGRAYVYSEAIALRQINYNLGGHRSALPLACR